MLRYQASPKPAAIEKVLRRKSNDITITITMTATITITITATITMTATITAMAVIWSIQTAKPTKELDIL